MKPITYLLAFAFSALANGQTKIDSLFALSQRIHNDSARMRIYIEIANNYKNKNIDSSRYFFEKALPLATKHPLTESKINFQIGELYYKSSNYDKSIEYLNRSLSIIDRYLNQNREEKNKQTNIWEKALIQLFLAKALSTKGDLSKAAEFYHSAANQFLKANDKNYASRCYNNLGVLFYSQSSYDSALTNYYKALSLREELKDTQNLANSYLNVAVIHMDRNETKQALDILQTALKLKISAKDTLGIAHCYNNMGNLHAELKNFDLAIDYFKKSLELRKTQNDWEGIVGSLNNLGTTYGDKRDFSSAITFYQEALKILKRVEDPILEAHCYTNLGNAYKNLKDYKNAIHYQERALKVRRQNNDLAEMSNILSNLASSYLELAISVIPPDDKLLKKSLDYAKQAYEIIRGKGNLFLEKGTVDILFKIYKHTNNLEEALKIAEQGFSLRDTIYQQEKIRQLAELENKYRSEIEKQLEINAQISSDLNKSSSNIYAFIVFLLIILLLCILLIRLNKKLKKNILNINKLNNEIQLLQNQNIVLTSELSGFSSSREEYQNDFLLSKSLIRLLLPMPNRFENSFKDSFTLYCGNHTFGSAFILFKNTKAFDTICLFSHNENSIQSSFFSIYVQTILSEFISKVPTNNSTIILDFIRATLQNISNHNPFFNNLLDESIFTIIVFDKKQKLVRFSSNNAMVMVYRFSENNDSSVVLPLAHPQTENLFSKSSISEQSFQLYDDDQLYVLSLTNYQSISPSILDKIKDRILQIGLLPMAEQRAKLGEKICDHENISVLLGCGIKI